MGIYGNNLSTIVIGNNLLPIVVIAQNSFDLLTTHFAFVIYFVIPINYRDKRFFTHTARKVSELVESKKYTVSIKSCYNFKKSRFAIFNALAESVNHLRTTGHRTTGHWTIGHRTTGHLDNWAPGQLGTGTTKHQDNWAPGQLGTGTTGHRDNWAPDNWALDNWALDNWAPDNWAPDNWAPDNWAPDNWALDNWALDSWAPGQLGTRTTGHQDNWVVLVPSCLVPSCSTFP